MAPIAIAAIERAASCLPLPRLRLPSPRGQNQKRELGGRKEKLSFKSRDIGEGGCKESLILLLKIVAPLIPWHKTIQLRSPKKSELAKL